VRLSKRQRYRRNRAAKAAARDASGGRATSQVMDLNLPAQLLTSKQLWAYFFDPTTRNKQGLPAVE
ncbi:hypothetical protein FRC07_014765, partial [Ceratobasidium sp. 392]